MKSVVRAFPQVVEAFDEVEVWAVECEVEHPKLNWQRMWAPRLWPLRLLWCVVGFHLRALWRFGILRQPRPDIIQCTDFYALFADVIYVHFHFARYWQILREKPDIIVLSKARKLLMFCCQQLERACFLWAKPKIWLTVSDSMADRLSEDERLAPISVLPNAYDPARYNPSVKEFYRATVRRQLGLDDSAIVLGFSALGDFERKGLPLLLAAAQQLRTEGHPVRVLIVGPSMEQVAKGNASGHKGYPIDRVIATGRVTDTERYFSAMDAFVFPSHCESFCLVLLEAAAMGIPVFPAGFDGHEMTLVEGENGALIPWDARGIASVINRSMRLIQQHPSSAILAKGVSDEVFQQELLGVYRQLRAV